MPSGRPTKLTPELIAKAQEYIDGGYEDQDDAVPSIVGLSRYLGKARPLLYQWRDENRNQAFTDILQNIVSEQKRLLLSKGLKGEFNSNIVKLMLGKHGYSDKQQIEQSGIDGKPIEQKWVIEIVDKENTEE